MSQTGRNEVFYVERDKHRYQLLSKNYFLSYHVSRKYYLYIYIRNAISWVVFIHRIPVTKTKARSRGPRSIPCDYWTESCFKLSVCVYQNFNWHFHQHAAWRGAVACNLWNFTMFFCYKIQINTSRKFPMTEMGVSHDSEMCSRYFNQNDAVSFGYRVCSPLNVAI